MLISSAGLRWTDPWHLNSSKPANKDLKMFQHFHQLMLKYGDRNLLITMVHSSFNFLKKGWKVDLSTQLVNMADSVTPAFLLRSPTACELGRRNSSLYNRSSVQGTTLCKSMYDSTLSFTYLSLTIN